MTTESTSTEAQVDATTSPSQKVTPPPLRADGVTFWDGLQALGEVSVGKGRKRVWLKKLDLVVFQFIGEQGVVTTEQLCRELRFRELKSCRTSWVYERVAFYREHGLVESKGLPGSKLRYLSLTRRAVNAGNSALASPIPHPPPKASELTHTLMLTEFRLKAQEAGRVARWVPERVLKASPTLLPSRLLGLIPDALWTTRSGKRIFLEYERTRKTKERRQEKFHAFAQEMGRPDRAMEMVVWVSEPGSIQMLEAIVHTTANQKVMTKEAFFRELLPK